MQKKINKTKKIKKGLLALVIIIVVLIGSATTIFIYKQNNNKINEDKKYILLKNIKNRQDDLPKSYSSSSFKK